MSLWVYVGEGIGGVFWSVFVRGKCTGVGLECQEIIY